MFVYREGQLVLDFVFLWVLLATVSEHDLVENLALTLCKSLKCPLPSSRLNKQEREFCNLLVSNRLLYCPTAHSLFHFFTLLFLRKGIWFCLGQCKRSKFRELKPLFQDSKPGPGMVGNHQCYFLFILFVLSLYPFASILTLSPMLHSSLLNCNSPSPSLYQGFVHAFVNKFMFVFLFFLAY